MQEHLLTFEQQWTDETSGRWSELLRRTFRIEIVSQKCKAPLRLIALIKSEDVAKKILTAMHQPVDIPQLRPARPPPSPQKTGGDDGWLN